MIVGRGCIRPLCAMVDHVLIAGSVMCLMADPMRVPLSELKVNPGRYLESARQRRVLLTRRGKVVGELVPIDEPDAASIRALLG